jgi:predicted Zn-dependent protease
VLLTNRSRLPDEANLALGEVYLARQEPGEAIPLLVRLAQSREPRPASLILLARAYLQQGRTSEALTTLRRAQTMPQTPRDRAGWQATMKSWEQARQ